MPAPSTMVARVKQQMATLMDRLRNVVQIRADVTSLGGLAYVAPVLDGGPPDPVPELSGQQLIDAMTALAAVNNVLGQTSELHRISLLKLAMTADLAVSRSRSSIREFREALEVGRQLSADLTDAAGAQTVLAYLTAEVGATDAQLVVDGLAAVASIDTTLNAGAGSRRKDLQRASD